MCGFGVFTCEMGLCPKGYTVPSVSLSMSYSNILSKYRIETMFYIFDIITCIIYFTHFIRVFEGLILLSIGCSTHNQCISTLLWYQFLVDVL